MMAIFNGSGSPWRGSADAVVEVSVFNGLVGTRTRRNPLGKSGATLRCGRSWAGRLHWEEAHGNGNGNGCKAVGKPEHRRSFALGPILRSLLRLGVAGLAEPGETGTKIMVEFPGVGLLRQAFEGQGDPGYMVRFSEMPRGLPRGCLRDRATLPVAVEIGAQGGGGGSRRRVENLPTIQFSYPSSGMRRISARKICW